VDAKELRARIDAARLYTHAVGGVTFQMRRPDPAEMRQAYIDGDGDERVAARLILERNLLGWDALPARMLDVDAGDAPVAFSEEARKLFLDEHTGGLADELYLDLGQRVAARRSQLEGTRGN
jgi:hypothetical protein